eukprot:362231-Chlamydomonas_euryale.AAC.7
MDTIDVYPNYCQCTCFYVEHAPDDLEILLDEAISQDFNVDAEDGSPMEVAKYLCKIYRECFEGNYSSVQKMMAQAIVGAQKSRRQVVSDACVHVFEARACHMARTFSGCRTCRSCRPLNISSFWSAAPDLNSCTRRCLCINYCLVLYVCDLLLRPAVDMSCGDHGFCRSLTTMAL